MVRRWALNLLLLVAIVTLGTYAWLRPGPAREPALPVSSLKSDQVRRIELSAGSEHVVLERRDGGWRMSAPLPARADRDAVARVLDLLGATSRQRLPRSGLREYDLDPPLVRLRFDQAEFGLGTTNPLTQERYLLTPEAVFPLAGYFAQVPARGADFLTHSLFAEGEVPVRLALGDFTVLRREGKWVREPAATDKRPAEDLARFAEDWRFASSLLTRSAPDPAPAGTRHVDVGFENGHGVTLEILQTEPELILRRPDEQLQFHLSGDLGKRLLAPTVTPAATPASAPRAP